jgi:hypothetical protein
MFSRPRILPWSLECLSEGYDLFFACLGFETRARSVSEDFTPRAGRKVACAFPDRHVLAFRDNHWAFERLGFEIEEVEDDRFEEWFGAVVGRLKHMDSEPFRVLIDLSSMSRYRLAVAIDLLRKGGAFTVDFVYRLAEFTPPPVKPGPNVHVGPVCDAFAGWSTEPEKPPVAIVGLGYEENRALGALEHIQASEAWLFRPKSSIAKYDMVLSKANRSLLENSRRERVFDYFVETPFDCFVILELLLSRLRQNASPLVFPFGPKIFALCSLLVAALYDDVAVWRVSAGAFEKAIDRCPSIVTCGLRAEFHQV